jgi:hypothetical protein
MFLLPRRILGHQYILESRLSHNHDQTERKEIQASRQSCFSRAFYFREFRYNRELK